MQSVATGQAPTTLERKITWGGKQIKQKIIHTIAETNRMPQTSRNNNGCAYSSRVYHLPVYTL